MRGVVSAGMTAALERLGLTGCFDLVVGASAGAINGAALIAGVAREGAAAYHGPLASRKFVNPARALRGRPVIDVSYVLEYASAGLDAGRHERVLASPIALHCVAVSVETADTVTFSGMASKTELYDAVLASSRMPWAGGPPVEIGGRRYVDGGLGSAIPVAEALDGRGDARARAADAPARRAAQERLADSRRADRAASACAQPCARHALPQARGVVRARGAGRRTAIARLGRRTALRARPAPAGGDAGGRAARTALGGPVRGSPGRRAPRRRDAAARGRATARPRPADVSRPAASGRARPLGPAPSPARAHGPPEARPCRAPPQRRRGRPRSGPP